MGWGVFCRWRTKTLAKLKEGVEAGARIEFHKRIADLRARLKEVGNKIGELQQTGERPWEDLKQGLENSWDILKASFTKAKSEFDQGYREGREDS